MTIKEGKQLIKALRKQGYSDEQIQYAFSMMYFNNQIDLEALNGLINLLGYHLEDEFLKMTKEEQYKWFKGGK